MTKLQTLYFTMIASCLMAAQASASGPSNVPEIDGGSAILATALVAGIVGLIREVKRKK